MEAKNKNLFCTFIIGFLVYRDYLCVVVYTKDKTGVDLNNGGKED